MGAFNGSGTFVRTYDWTTDEGNGINIEASRMDTEDDGFATGLSTCITKDGQTTISANIPFNSKKITGFANGSARTDSIALGQVQDGTYQNLGTTGGSADTYTLSPSPSITTYTGFNGLYLIKINADNTGASTINISAVGAKDVKKFDGAGSKVDVEAGDLQQDQYYIISYDGTDIIVYNPEKPYIDLSNSLNTATTSTVGAVYLSDKITISNNGTDADHDIDFTAGVFTFDDGSGQAVASALTKQIDAAWVEGDAAGGLDTGSVAADTTYHMFAIWNPTTETADFLFSTSATSPTLPSGYTKQKRIAALRTDGSANIRGGTWYVGNGIYHFVYNTSIDDISSASATEERTETPTITCPPESKVFLSIKMRENSLNSGDIPRVIFTETSQDDVAPTIANSDLFIQGGSTNLYANNNTWSGYTDSSGQIRLRTAQCDASVTIYGSTSGWQEYL